MRVLAILAEHVIWARFRETGASYSFDVGAFRSPGVDLFIAALPVRDVSGADVSRYLDSAMEDIRAGRFDDAALERARAIAIGDMAAADENPAAVASELAQGGTAWHGPELDAALRALDRASFVQRAGAWLDRERSIAIHFGPKERR